MGLDPMLPVGIGAEASATATGCRGRAGLGPPPSLLTVVVLQASNLSTWDPAPKRRLLQSTALAPGTQHLCATSSPHGHQPSAPRSPGSLQGGSSPALNSKQSGSRLGNAARAGSTRLLQGLLLRIPPHKGCERQLCSFLKTRTPRSHLQRRDAMSKACLLLATEREAGTEQRSAAA